ncbi:mediator of RNA polymerase II transcription subunit 25 isoform X3 [Medicago truncatula]|uniref:Uncharacterized protein n=1 Tax=Medicago truncatula TaxID=3880 RepID=A0A072UEW6_MEDTR|nr:mediator of RNA polymerase II transcription subunit 25 isoform X3 [Medicago truncatula]KEH27966.1 hypothetical protein MTR_5g054690 [Medicago truncatula]
MMQNGVNMDEIGGQSHETQNGWHRSSPIWEGSLYGRKQGEPIFITKLEGYRRSSASETLAANWPPEMHIVRIISQDHMNNKKYVGEADFLVFRARNTHGFLGLLQEKKLDKLVSKSQLSSLQQQQHQQMQSQHTTSAQSNYISVWEGSLLGLRHGQPKFISKLEAYRSSSSSETLVANWSPEMQIVQLIPQDHMNNLQQYVGNADFLVFRAMNPHGFLGQLQEKKLCAVIQLPSQTLLLSVSDIACCRLIGMLFSRDMFVFNQQQQMQQMQQMQQQHQLSQLQLQLSQLQLQHQQLLQQPQMDGHFQMVSQGHVSSQGATNIEEGNLMS